MRVNSSTTLSPLISFSACTSVDFPPALFVLASTLLRCFSLPRFSLPFCLSPTYRTSTRFLHFLRRPVSVVLRSWAWRRVFAHAVGSVMRFHTGIARLHFKDPGTESCDGGSRLHRARRRAHAQGWGPTAREKPVALLSLLRFPQLSPGQ